MTEDRSVPSSCDDVADELAELALGTLTGRDRVVVLAHIEGCARCSAEVEQLSVAADALLQVAPAIEPPLGFEVRLFDQLGVPPWRHVRIPAAHALRKAGRISSVRTALVAAVVVLVLGLGIGVGLAVAPTATPVRSADQPVHVPGDQVAVANLTSNGAARGQVSTYAGTPAWLFMTVHDVGSTGQVSCRVTLADGSTALVGAFWISRGYGAWGAPLPAPASQIRAATIVAADGKVLASATFHA